MEQQVVFCKRITYDSHDIWTQVVHQMWEYSEKLVNDYDGYNLTQWLDDAACDGIEFFDNLEFVNALDNYLQENGKTLEDTVNYYTKHIDGGFYMYHPWDNNWIEKYLLGGCGQDNLLDDFKLYLITCGINCDFIIH